MLFRSHKHGARIESQIDPRPQHDFRYGVDATKLQQELGWRRSPDMWAQFEVTVQWYLDHRDWWQPLTAEAESIYNSNARTLGQAHASKDLEGQVVQLLQSKIELPAGELYLLRDPHTIQSAIGYFVKHGDFSVRYDPGDGVEDPMRIDGNVNPFLLIGPPGQWPETR